MLQIAICEDQAYMRKELEKKVADFARARQMPAEISSYAAGEQLLLSGSKYDVILMDIGLAGISGMDTARRLRELGQTCAIIFITSDPQQVFSAFDVRATHYLVKPVKEAQLYSALDLALAQLHKRDDQGVVLTKGQLVRKILYRDIVYCEAVGHNLVFVLNSGERVTEYGSLAELVKKVDSRFFQCHRSYLLNLAQVAALENETARMTNGDEVLISRRKRKQLSQRLLEYLCREVLS